MSRQWYRVGNDKRVCKEHLRERGFNVDVPFGEWCELYDDLAKRGVIFVFEKALREGDETRVKIVKQQAYKEKLRKRGFNVDVPFREWGELYDDLAKNGVVQVFEKAAMEGDETRVKIVVNVVEKFGILDMDTAFLIAAENGLRDIVEILLPRAHGQAINEALETAADNGRLEIVNTIIPQLQPHTHEAIDKALVKAAYHDNIEIVEALLPHGNEHSIGVALAHGGRKTMDLLLPRADDESKRVAFTGAAARGYIDVVEALVPLADNALIMDAMGKAALYGRVEVMKTLLPRADKEAIDTVFKVAVGVYRNNREVIERLLPHVSKQLIREALKTATRDHAALLRHYVRRLTAKKEVCSC